jgi:trk system potassium uptake protein TrkH
MDSPPPQSRSFTRPKRQAEPYAERIIVHDIPPSEIGETIDPNLKARRRTLSSMLGGPWILILGFAGIIVIGAILLKLPWAAAPGYTISWSDALFTSTSAVTVTGLVVVNTAEAFSLFGQVAILILLQVGGVGFIAFSVLLFRIIGRRVTLQTRFIVQQSLATNELDNAIKLALYVLGVTLMLEAGGALLLWLRWRTTLPDGTAAWYAIFHAVSSYCNAGFDLFSGTSYASLFGYGSDWYSLAVMGILILLGGFGITVMYDIWTSSGVKTWSLNTRITLVLTAFLTGIGTLVILSDPKFVADVLPTASWLERSAVGLFTMVSARTAGLTLFSLPYLSESTQLIILFWMFIGGAPASMAGGVSSSTIGVLIFAVIATARGRAAAVAFGRTLPHETIAKAVAIMTVSTLLVATITVLLALDSDKPIFSTGFEVVSAFANAGYSLDFTAGLSEFGRFLVAFAMFWGRLGPLTIVVALAQREKPTLIRYPEEPVILG